MEVRNSSSSLPTTPGSTSLPFFLAKKATKTEAKTALWVTSQSQDEMTSWQLVHYCTFLRSISAPSNKAISSFTQAVTSQGSRALEVLFGFRGGARRGRVSRELSCCWKTGTFQHGSQTSFCLRFTALLEKGWGCWGNEGHRSLRCSLWPLGGSTAKHPQAACLRWRSSRPSERSVSATVRFNSQSTSLSTGREMETGFVYTCFTVKWSQWQRQKM